MNKLEEARIEINEADSMMAKIFEQRFMAVKDVLAYKKEQDLPIFDPVREQEVIARNTALVSEELQPYYKEYLQMLMDISKKYQKDLLKGE